MSAPWPVIKPKVEETKVEDGGPWTLVEGRKDLWKNPKGQFKGQNHGFYSSQPVPVITKPVYPDVYIDYAYGIGIIPDEI